MADSSGDDSDHSETGELIHLAEYAKSDRSSCKGCRKLIRQDSVRFGKLVQSKHRDGKDSQWYHPKCFVKKYNKVTYVELAGLETLRWTDQEALRSLIEDANSKPKPRKGRKRTRKVDDETSASVKRPRLDDTTLANIEKDVTLFYEARDRLKENFGKDKKKLTTVIQYNGQEVPTGVENILDFLADIVVFGPLDPCDACGGQLIYKSGSGGYQCTGNLTEYSKCLKNFKDPGRIPFKVPPSLKSNPAFKGMKFNARKRTVPKYAPHSPQSEQLNLDTRKGPPLKKTDLPLYKMEFFMMGQFDAEFKKEIKSKIEEFGGVMRIKAKFGKFLITTVNDYENQPSDLAAMIKQRNPLILAPTFANNLSLSEDFDLLKVMQTHMLSDSWSQRLPSSIPQWNNWTKLKYGNAPTFRPLQWVDLDVMDETDVDWRSGLFDEGIMYKEGDKYYNCALVKCSIQDGTNSYYAMQIITTPKKETFWVFCRWGRIGVSYGGQKLYDALSCEEAVATFKQIFAEKTGNDWDGMEFQKKAGLYEIIHRHSGADTEKLPNKLTPTPLNTKLPLATQELISIIFSKKEMERNIIQLKLDYAKMPLGSLSPGLLKDGYEILSKAEQILMNGSDKNNIPKLMDLTNRYYTKVPHCFNTINKQTALDNMKTIQEERDVLNQLHEVVFAYETLKRESQNSGDKSTDLMNGCYAALNCNIQPMTKDDEDFRIVQKYLTESQSDCHEFDMILVNMFRVARREEDERFKDFEGYENRRLLWHGSPVSNIPGILTHGLKGCPDVHINLVCPRGVYFADVASKSAGYSRIPSLLGTGVLLLCEVALGKIFEDRRCMPTLPPEHHSFKVIGRCAPPELTTLPSGVQIATGKPRATTSQGESQFRHNEYIVFNEGQIRIKYLLTFQKEPKQIKK